MIKTSKVVAYIEKLYGVKLLDIQKDCLKHIITGDLIYTPRCFGRSMLYDGYAAYLKDIEGSRVDYSVDPIDFDKVYTYDEVPCGTLYPASMIANYGSQDSEKFKREYCGEYTTYSGSEKQ